MYVIMTGAELEATTDISESHALQKKNMIAFPNRRISERSTKVEAFIFTCRHLKKKDEPDGSDMEGSTWSKIEPK